MNELILYQTPDGKTKVHLRAEEGSVWLTQMEIAELFSSSKQNISLHINNILDVGELLEQAVVKENLTTAIDGKKYRTKLYRLVKSLMQRAGAGAGCGCGRFEGVGSGGRTG